jgi:hypothetical protein
MSQAANNVDSIKGVLVCLIFGGGLIWSAMSRRKKARKVEDTPRSKVSSAPQGLVELQGFAWPKNLCVRTIDEREAVCYHISIERKETQGSGKNRRTTWVSVFAWGHTHPFYLVDATGLAEVHPGMSELDVATKQTRSWSALTKQQRVQVVALVGGRPIAGFPPGSGFFGLFSSAYRVVESEIRVGSPLYASGSFRTPTAHSEMARVPGLTSFAARVLNFEKRSFKDVTVLLDKNKDGKVTEDEAREGYSFAARLSRDKAQKGEEPEKEFPVFGVLERSASHALVLADAHESHLVNRLNRFFYPKILSGAALITLGIALLLMSVGLGPRAGLMDRLPSQGHSSSR